jgi:predicted nuclease of predicted toxin-antitoxin system
MNIWLDAQLSPKLSHWLTVQFAVEAKAVRDLGLRDAEDKDIFFAAKQANAIMMTKDSDFIDLLERYDVPPQVIWITCDNTSNQYLKQILLKTFPQVLTLLASGEKLVEISDPW